MTKLLCRSLALVALTGLASGCGKGVDAGGSGKSSDWAVDACKTFPAEAASKAAGMPVAKVETSSQAGTDQVKLSNCTYSSTDGRTNFGILLRDTKDETVDQLIAGISSQPDITGPSEPVAMPRGKAIWAPKLRTLSYVPADGRMIVVTPPGAITFGTGAPPPGDLKAKAIAIANAIEK